MNRDVMITVASVIVLFGGSTFARKMAVNRMHPYELQLIASAIYVSMIPVWLCLLEREGKKFDVTFEGYLWGFVTITSYIFAAVLFGKLLKGSDEPGLISAIVALNPALTLALTYFFLDEPIGLRKIAAFCCIFAALILLA